MKRFILHSWLKPEKVEEYKYLHAHIWPEIKEILLSCNLHNYSISIFGTELFTYYEYRGDNYEADSAKAKNLPINEKWSELTKPCFLYHEYGLYYDKMEEIFYLE